MRWPSAAWVAITVATLGCGDLPSGERQAGGAGGLAGIAPVDLDAAAPPQPNMDSAPPPVATSSVAAAPANSSDGPPPPISVKDAPPPAAAPEPAVVADPNVVREKAAIGATGKGQYGGGGIITTPVSVYFQAQERIAYEIAVPHALNLYRASNDGKNPPTHDDFMRDIIQYNAIALPILPEGSRYVFDPELGELMVETTAP